MESRFACLASVSPPANDQTVRAPSYSRADIGKSLRTRETAMNLLTATSTTWSKPLASTTWSRPAASTTWSKPVASTTWSRLRASTS